MFDTDRHTLAKHAQLPPAGVQRGQTYPHAQLNTARQLHLLSHRQTRTAAAAETGMTTPMTAAGLPRRRTRVRWHKSWPRVPGTTAPRH